MTSSQSFFLTALPIDVRSGFPVSVFAGWKTKTSSISEELRPDSLHLLARSTSITSSFEDCLVSSKCGCSICRSLLRLAGVRHISGTDLDRSSDLCLSLALKDFNRYSKDLSTLTVINGLKYV